MIRLIVDVIEPTDPVDPVRDRDAELYSGKVVLRWAEGHPMRHVEGQAPYVMTELQRMMHREAAAPAYAVLRSLLTHREQGQRFIVTREVPAPASTASRSGRRAALLGLLRRFRTRQHPRHQ